MQSHHFISNKLPKKTVVASLLSIYLLSGCGGSSNTDKPDEDTQPDNPPVTTTYDHQVSGVVAYHQLVSGADVCVDLNQNQLCDTDEPTSVTDVEGKYQIDWTSEVEAPKYMLVASWAQAAPVSISPTKLEINAAPTKPNAANKPTFEAVVNNDGQAKLMARQAHQGEINYLTHLEVRRLLEMIAQDLPEAEVELLLSKLETILKGLLEEAEANPYLFTNEEYLQKKIVIIERLLGYLELVLADIAFEALKLEELLLHIHQQAKTLIEGSSLSIEDYLASDPLEFSFLINNSLTMLGHIENPFDDRIMSANDWQIVEANFFSDDEGLSNLITLNLTPSVVFVGVSDDTNKQLLGTLSTDGFNHHIFDYAQEPGSEVGEEQIRECWNHTELSWEQIDGITPTEPIAPYIYVDNSLTTQFMVSDAHMTFTFTKVDTQSDFWESIIAATPAPLALADISWPGVMYTFDAVQDKDVMCRIKDDYETYELSSAIDEIEQLSTSIVARSLFPNEDPLELQINEAEKTFYHPLEGQTNRWTLLQGPNGTDIIEIDDASHLPGLEPYSLKEYYTVRLDGVPRQLEHIELHTTDFWANAYPQFVYTYDNSEGFSQALFEHFKNL
ncbi:hypothetical protein G3R49_01975 [Shewanella sp. WXL01]|uniref:hypothetical protein n=1 Tax=Shewanella sp. WXL01 TaxID=2709721 RepID=UPI00143837A3|nr:hypothetical protein [Shewanella sp. WXL01]NKF49348.1 hypothetical protein [Shewanella sp. WXL01]